MSKSVKRLYRSGYTAPEIANMLGKSLYSVNKTIKNKGYNSTYAREHRAFNSYKNGKPLSTVVKQLGKSKTTFYRELKTSGHKKALQSDHKDDFVKGVKKFLKNAKEKNFKNYAVGYATYKNKLVQSWNKKGKKIPRYFFKGINAQSDLRDFDLNVKSVSKIRYFDANGNNVSKQKIKSRYNYDIAEVVKDKNKKFSDYEDEDEEEDEEDDY